MPETNKYAHTAFPSAMPDPSDPAALRREMLRQTMLAAENRIEKGGWDSATATKVGLDRVSKLVADEARCVLITADTKSLESATRKINDECDGHWLDLKDVARVTLAATDEAQLAVVIRVLRRVIVPSEGFTFAKDVQTLAESDACGYSGYNFVVRFGTKPVSAARPSTATAPTAPSKTAFLNAKPAPQHLMSMTERQIMAAMQSRPAPTVPLYVGRLGEIQANTYAMMYAKMGRSTFEKMFGAPKWEECFHQTGVEGGMGHLFYEDWRVDKASENGKRIADLSKRYYRRMRGTDPKPSKGGDTLDEEVKAYVAARPAH